MMVSRLGIAAAFVVGLGYAGPASAVIINGSFAFSPTTTETYTPNNINFTQFSWTGSPAINVGTRNGDFLGGAAPLASGQSILSTVISGSGFQLAGSPTPQSVSNFLTFSDTGSIAYHYDMTSWSQIPVTSNITGINTFGTLIGSNGVNQLAVANFSFNQSITQGGTVVSGSATLSTGASLPPPPPPPFCEVNCPEPASMAALGSGLIGLGMVRRRRNRKA